MKFKNLIYSALIIIIFGLTFVGCMKDDTDTGTLKVTYSKHPSDLKAYISPAENSDLAITDWITPKTDGILTYELNPGNYILSSWSAIYFPKIGFQINAGQTTEIVFDGINGGHVK